MRETPPECELVREVEFNICLACQDQCSLGKRAMKVFEKYRNDKWYEKMRREIDTIGER